jgi:hypothetical protein
VRVLIADAELRIISRALRVAKREFVYTVLFSLKMGDVLRSQEQQLTAANAEEKCNIQEGLTRDEDLWCGNKVRNKEGAGEPRR